MGLPAYYCLEEKKFIQISSNPFEQSAIDYDFVSNLYEDKEKNVWVSSNKGLYRFNIDAQAFSNIPNRRINDTTVIHNAVSTILQTINNGIWISTWGAGIFSYDNKLQPIANPLTTIAPANSSLYTCCMIQHRNGEIWMGINTGEIKIYEPATGRCFTTSPAILTGEVIQQLREDSEGNTWIGTNTGMLVKCINGNWKDSSFFKKILIDIGDIMRIYEDNARHLWVCSATTGVYEMDMNGKVLKQFKEAAGKNNGLLKDGATDILQYDDSTYLIASGGLCILNRKTNTFRYLRAADDLPAENITSLLLDKQKHLWVTLDAGVYKLNIYNKLYVTFNEPDGITNNIFQVSSGTVLQDGRIMLGTPKDFLVFDPEKTVDTSQPPPVHITGIKLGSDHISTDSILKLGKLELSYDNTFVNIELSTLHFRDNYSIHYMLEGLDKTWKPAEDNKIIYQYLPPGSYKLLLRSENGEVLNSKNFSSLEIKINPPFWKTGWFFGLLALLIAGILFWFDQQRMKRKEAILNMRSNIADGLHYDISAALANITILSEMAKIKAAAEPEKSKEFIEQIHSKSQNMTNAMDDILWSIDPDNDSMEHFIAPFNEYVDALKSQHAAEVATLVDNNVQLLHLNMKIRNDIFWLFKAGIKNVLKTGGRNCRIHISYKKPLLSYTLEFDTVGMDTGQINKISQRKELFDKLQALGANLQFKENKTMAVFELNIPVKRSGL
ncbi:hypothetical protein BH11BAC4_BH11BAC4_09490 [soil metagenome]